MSPPLVVVCIGLAIWLAICLTCEEGRSRPWRSLAQGGGNVSRLILNDVTHASHH
ncbi:MAG: hypothetical protein GY903_19880 [Fuerstiella sp.]|nr:hypothetical protein [Fuerstiella sp.]